SVHLHSAQREKLQNRLWCADRRSHFVEFLIPQASWASNGERKSLAGCSAHPHSRRLHCGCVPSAKVALADSLHTFNCCWRSAWPGAYRTRRFPLDFLLVRRSSRIESCMVHALSQRDYVVTRVQAQGPFGHSNGLRNPRTSLQFARRYDLVR